MTFKTDQEAFWAGEFGTEYIARNRGPGLLAANVALFARALARAGELGSCIEFGANVGLNLDALKLLFPGQDQHAVEINPDAAAELRKRLPSANVHQASLLEFRPSRTWELVLIKGVLIHIQPDVLPTVYDLLHRATGRHLLVCEYYNPTPVAIPYRGHADRLFKRDFCGELLDRHKDLRLIDYGFVYHRDPHFPQDDVNWFLLGKSA
ncbi:MAG: pseudaminic acid biosynthesis-associated methylase [Rhodanobacteraceae bacterium]